MDDSRSAQQAELEHAASFRAELRRFLARTGTATGKAGLTPQRYDLLLAIKAAGGQATITELCAHLEMRQTAVTELVRRAEEAKLTERSPSRVDRRGVVVTLTPEAEARLKRGFDAFRDDRAALAQALELLAEAARAPALDPRQALGPPLRLEQPPAA